MTKIMLVEDDNNLREIYEARLGAEGYDIVSAQDGEAALALAGKEHPDLIITDVMMPKISGFEMLDILRNTEALRSVKVIMLTALGQAEDNARAGALGADRYLVKSQVTLEDIVKAAHDVLDSGADMTVADTATSNTADDSAAAVDTPADDETAAPQSSPWQSAGTADEPAADPVTTEMTPEVTSEIPGPIQTDDQAAGQSDSGSAAPVPEPFTDDVPAPTTDSEEPVAESTAEPVSDEQATVPGADEPAVHDESSMRQHIEQFLGATPRPGDTTTAVTNDAPVPEVAVSDGPADTPEAEQAVETTIPDEPDSEYDKEAGIPDMGMYPIQQPGSAPEADIPLPAPVADTPPTFDTPAPTFDIPAPPDDLQLPQRELVSQPPIAPEPATPTTQQQDDQVVASAVSDMFGSSNPGPSVTPLQQAAVPTADTQPSAPAPESRTEHGGSVSSRVIQPLGQPTKPDINQLLSMEDARTAAAQAAGQVPSPAGYAQPPAGQQPAPQQLPPNPYGGQPGPSIDPNSISL